jgi:hypothetical protein
MPGGHDHNYPDFLPPADAWGTTRDFSNMFRRAQARGLLVMPYTNPTWWDANSPTLKTLPSPLTITNLTVLNDQRIPLFQDAYVISPYPAFVQKRLREVLTQITAEIPRPKNA